MSVVYVNVVCVWQPKDVQYPALSLHLDPLETVSLKSELGWQAARSGILSPNAPQPQRSGCTDHTGYCKRMLSSGLQGELSYSVPSHLHPKEPWGGG